MEKQNSKTENYLSYEELLQQVSDLRLQLKQSELDLCNKDIESVQLKMKYLASERKLEFWKNQSDYNEAVLSQITNSKTWKLRNHLLSLIRKNGKKQESNTITHTLTNCNLEELEEAVALPDLPEDPLWEACFMNYPRIAIQVHAFYPDLIADICNWLQNMPFPFDLYITTTEKYKQTYIEDYLSKHCNANHYYVEVVENKGRDVIPLLQQLKPVLTNYDYFCHLHTKRSLHYEGGKHWRNYLYENLLGSTNHIKKILWSFERDPKIGVIFPDIPIHIKCYLDWGNNKIYATELLQLMNHPIDNIPNEIFFPAGTMFWARTHAVKDLFDVDYSASLVPDELGQIDGTIMHAIERLWLYVAELNGYTYHMFPNITKITTF